MFNSLHSITNQQLFKKHLCNPHIPKERNGVTCLNYFNYHLKSEVSITLRCRICSTHYTAVRIKNCLKSTSVVKNSHYENMDDFRFEGKPSRATFKSTLFAVSEDEWDTKEDTGKSMKNALYILWYAKRHLSGWSDIKQWKNQVHSLSRYRVMFLWRHQSDTHRHTHTHTHMYTHTHTHTHTKDSINADLNLTCVWESESSLSSLSARLGWILLILWANLMTLAAIHENRKCVITADEPWTYVSAMSYVLWDIATICALKCTTSHCYKLNIEFTNLVTIQFFHYVFLHEPTQISIKILLLLMQLWHMNILA